MLSKHIGARSLACLAWIALSAADARLSAQSPSVPRIITTVAGTDFTFPTGPVKAINAPTGAINGVTTDHNGNLYLSDAGNHLVMKVDATGTLTVVAGNGIAGYSGDGGPATSASLSAPAGLAADNSGNLFIADNGRVRQVSSSGIITTLSGLTSISSIALDQAGNLYAAGIGSVGIQKWTPSGAVSTVTGSANLFANAIAVDGNGNIFITGGQSLAVNGVDGVVYELSANGSLQTIAQGLNYPRGLRVDAAGNIYVAEYSTNQNNSNRVLEVTSGVVHTIAGTGLIPLSGDGGPALNASMGPVDLALDDNGGILIADTFNSRVRLLKAGIVTTVVGNGGFQFGGDQGPTISAFLHAPSGVAVDSQGNLIIADSGNNRIRLVSPAGTITTVAGNGIADFRGDGGAAIAASLNDPQGVAVDTAGNIFVADTGNNRIRKVTPAGVISTVAGNGNSVFIGGIRYILSPGYTDPTFSGDGGPATSAPLSFPTAVALDSSDDIFVAELFRIRKITPDGNIVTVAGSGPGVCPPAPFQGYCGSFGGDGGAATSATLNAPDGVAVDSQGDIIIADSGNGRIREVSRQGQINTVVQTNSVTFDPHIPPIIRDTPLGVAVDQVGDIYYSDVFFQDQNLFNITLPQAAKIGELTAAGMLTTVAGGGTQGFFGDGGAATAAALKNPVGLAIDANGNIYFCDTGNNRIREVLAAPALTAPNLSASVHNLAFTASQGSAATTQSLQILNTGGGSLPFTATISSTGGSWLSLSAQSGVATSASPAILSVTATPGSLLAGTYTGSIAISSAVGSITIPVTLSIAAPSAAIQISQNALIFNAVAQGSAPLPEIFGILNSGQGSMPWEAVASTLSGGDWLQVSSSSGSVQQPSVDVSTLSARINPAGLKAGTYYGKIQISSGAAINSPQSLTVILNVLAETTNLGLQLYPGGLIFTGNAGSNPAPQDILIANTSSGSISYSSSTVGPLAVAPANAVILPNSPAMLHVQPDFSNIGPGVSHGTIALQFSDGSPSQTISVLMSAGPGASGATSCPPPALNIVFRAPQAAQSFTAIVGQSLTLEAVLSDSCGNPIVAGGQQPQIVASINNGDTAPPMTYVGNGVWQTAWAVAQAAPSITVTVSALAKFGNTLVGGQATLHGSAVAPSPGASAPLIGSVNHAASAVAGVPIAPGELIAIKGANLATGSPANEPTPLPLSFNGTQVSLGDQPLPILYGSSGQMNVQVPFTVPVNTTYELSVQNGATISVPQTVVVATAQPGIFTINEQGFGQGAIFKSDDVTLAQPGTPASIGEVVVIYCTGLGAVSPAVPAGQSAPSTPPLATTVNPIAVTIGGQPGQVQFSGLTPGAPGVYQINVAVPSGIATGDAVSVTISMAGLTSQPGVTMAIR